MNYLLKFYPILMILFVFISNKLEWAKGANKKIYLLLLLALLTLYVVLRIQAKKTNGPLFAVYAVGALLLLLLLFNVL